MSDEGLYQNHWRCRICEGLLPPTIAPKGTATAACGCEFHVCCEVTKANAEKRAARFARSHEKRECELAACA